MVHQPKRKESGSGLVQVVGAGRCFLPCWLGKGAERYQPQRKMVIQVVVSCHVGWGGLQKGINQRERRVAMWFGSGSCFWP
jgi:hypothetical protein